MKVNVTSYKNPNRGLRTIDRGNVVTCDAHPSVPYMVADWESKKELVNLETGMFASHEWVDGQVWHVRDAELIVK